MKKIEITEKNKHNWIEWFEYSLSPGYNLLVEDAMLTTLGFSKKELESEDAIDIVREKTGYAIINLLKNNSITPKWKKS